MIVTHTTCSENQQPCVIIQRQLLRSGFQSCHDDLLKYIDIHARSAPQMYYTSTGFETQPAEFDITDYYMHRMIPSINTEKNPFLSLGQKVMSTIENVLSPVNTSFYIAQSWGNKLVQGDMIIPHSHAWNGPKAVYAYVYNVSVCENCAPLIFPTIDNGRRISLKTGQLIIFSGWLMHAVDEHKCDHPRVNAGGNIGREI